jgi:hypothetical protein
MEPKPERRVTPDRRANPRGGRRSTGNDNQERELRAKHIAEYLSQQKPNKPAGES